MPRAFLLVVCLLALGAMTPAGVTRAAAQDVSIQARTSDVTVGEDETVGYSIEVRGASANQIRIEGPPETTGLVLQQQRPSVRRELTYVDGAMERTITYTWRFTPLRTGMAVFRATPVTVRGRTYETSPIRIRVVPQTQRAPGSSPGSAAGPGDERRAVFGDDDLFIRAEISDDAVYLNEQVVLTYRLFFRESITVEHSRLSGSWDAPGFWREELEVAPYPVPRDQNVDGASYQTITLKRVALFPTRTGTLTIDPLRIETTAHRTSSRRRSSIIDRLFALRSRSNEVVLASDTATVTVRPLPDGAPPSFSGAVGSFALEARLTPARVETGTAAALRLRLEGSGNVATLGPPTPDLPDAIEAYDPQTSTTIRRTGRRARGWSTFDYTLVPQEPGTYALPPVAFSYFDPEAARYETLEAAVPTLRVEGAAPAEATASRTRSGLPLDDLAPLATTGRWYRAQPRPLHRQVWPYAALALPALLLAAFAAFRRRTAVPSATAPAPTDARVLLDRGCDHLRHGRTRPGCDALELAVHAALAERLGRATRHLGRSELEALMTDRGVAADARRRTHALLEACDRARFAPRATAAAEEDALCNRADDLLRTLTAPTAAST